MATTPSAAKPLPRLPNILPRSTGVIERDLPPAAREHVRKIIAQCVADESLATSWISLVHQAVEDIGRAVTDDNWLPGLCALKDARRRRVLESSDIITVDNVTLNNNEYRDGRETPRHRHLMPLKHLGTPGSPGLSPRRLRAPKLRGAELLELNTRALAELARLAGDSQAMFSSLDMIHLVVTLVSPDADDPSLASSSTPRCMFVKNQFVLPTAEDDSAGVLDLCGIESWKCKYTRLGC